MYETDKKIDPNQSFESKGDLFKSDVDAASTQNSLSAVSEKSESKQIFLGEIKKQVNNYASSQLEVSYRSISLPFSDAKSVITKDLINSKLNEWVDKKVLAMAIPDLELFYSYLDYFHIETFFKKYGKIYMDFSGSNKAVVKDLTISDYGLDIILDSNVSDLKDTLLIVDSYNSSFIDKIIARKNIITIKEVGKKLNNDNNYLLILLRSKNDENQFKRFLSENKEFQDLIAYWNVDFLQTFFHIHFEGNGKVESDVEANELYNRVADQIKKGLWKENRFDLYSDLVRYVKGSNLNKGRLRELIYNYSNRLKTASPTEVQIDIEKNLQEKAWTLINNENWKVKGLSLFTSFSDSLRVADAKFLIDIIKKHIILAEEKDDEKKKKKKKKKSKSKLRGEIFSSNTIDIIKIAELTTYSLDDGSQVIDFKDSSLKSILREEFMKSDPFYVVSIFNYVLRLYKDGSILTEEVSNSLFESIVSFSKSIAASHPEEHGTKIFKYLLGNLIQKNASEKFVEFNDENEIDEDKALSDIISKSSLSSYNMEIALYRLAYIVDFFYASDQNNLKDFIYNSFLKPFSLAQNNKRASSTLLSLLRRADSISQSVKLNLLRNIFNHSQLIEIRNDALKFLNSFSRYIYDGSLPYIEEVLEWRPEDIDYSNFQNANAKRIGVVYFINYADWIGDSQDVKNLGCYPPKHFLLSHAIQNTMIDAKLLDKYVSYIFDPRMVNAVGNWIVQEHLGEYWSNRVNLNQSGNSFRERLDYYYAYLKSSKAINSKYKLYSELAIAIRIEQQKILEDWITVILGSDFKNWSADSIRFSECIIASLNKNISGELKKELIARWRLRSDMILFDLGDLSLSKSERKVLSSRRKIIKFLIKGLRSQMKST